MKLWMALGVAATLATSLPAHAQATSAATAGVTRKDPSLASILSFVVPGAGQFYAGAPGKGAFFLVADIAGAAMVVHGVACNNGTACTAERCSYQTGCTTSRPGSGWIAAGAGLLVANTIMAMVDAHQDADKYNRDHGLVAALERAHPVLALGTRGETRIGLALGGR